MLEMKKDEIFIGKGSKAQLDLLIRNGIECRFDGDGEKLKPIFIKEKDINKYISFMMNK